MINVNELLKEKLATENYNRLMAVDNLKIHEFVADAVELAGPESVFVCTDSKEDVEYVRRMAVESGEENPLETPGHTYHFDGPSDQGRDRKATKYLVPKTETLSEALNQVGKGRGTRRGARFAQRLHEGQDDDSPVPVVRARRFGLQCSMRSNNRFVVRGPQRRFALSNCL